MDWIAHNGELCLSGYPIKIVRRAADFGAPYIVTQDNRADAAGYTLESAKSCGERWARELDEFG